MADIRPWRKLKLQFVSAEKWIAVGEEVVDGALAQVGGHGAWDKDQTMQVSDYSTRRINISQYELRELNIKRRELDRNSLLFI